MACMKSQPQLRNKTGALDVENVARAFGIPIDEMNCLLRISQDKVATRRSTEALQAELSTFERIYSLTTFRQVTPDFFRTWLHTPLESLEGDTPIDLIRAGKGDLVAELVENGLAGGFN